MEGLVVERFKKNAAEGVEPTDNYKTIIQKIVIVTTQLLFLKND